MTDADIIQAKITRNHNWRDAKEKRFAACEMPDGNGRTERTCPVCHLVKITVHPPHPHQPWREWRGPDGVTFRVAHTPPCWPVYESSPVASPSVNQEQQPESETTLP